MNNLRNILSYIIGFCIFMLLFPSIQWYLSKKYIMPIFYFPTIGLILSIPFLISGVLLIWYSNYDMYRIGQGTPTDGFNINIGERTKYLMTEGVYRICRNPMLLGTILIYLSISLMLNSVVAFIFTMLFSIYMYYHVQWFEEPRLLRDFGNTYLKYKCKTPRLFPFRFNI